MTYISENKIQLWDVSECKNMLFSTPQKDQVLFNIYVDKLKIFKFVYLFIPIWESGEKYYKE